MKEEPRGQSGYLFRTIIAAAILLTSAFGLQFVPGLEASEADDKPMFMFVHTADDVKADPAAGTLRLVNVNPQTVYFSDRPERIAGHMTLVDYLKEWNKGKDNFGEDPPNATLSVYEGGGQKTPLPSSNSTNPVVEGADLIYSYKSLGGKMPTSGGATTLFIDMIGIGGGVGVGYHGVGVGLRGPGVL